MTFYYMDSGNKPAGPVTQDDLKRLIQSGQVPADPMVVPVGETRWDSLSRHLAPPPPPPGAPAKGSSNGIKLVVAVVGLLVVVGGIAWFARSTPVEKQAKDVASALEDQAQFSKDLVANDKTRFYYEAFRMADGLKSQSAEAIRNTVATLQTKAEALSDSDRAGASKAGLAVLSFLPDECIDEVIKAFGLEEMVKAHTAEIERAFGHIPAGDPIGDVIAQTPHDQLPKMYKMVTLVAAFMRQKVDAAATAPR